MKSTTKLTYQRWMLICTTADKKKNKQLRDKTIKMAKENEAEFSSQECHFVEGDSNQGYAEDAEHKGHYDQDSSGNDPASDEGKNGSKL